LKQALLIHQGAIGDFVIVCRLIEFCNRAFGRHRWSYLGKPSHGRLAAALQLIEEVEDFERPGWHLLFTREEKPPQRMVEFIRRFDLILNVVEASGGIFARRVEEICPGKVFHIDPKLPPNYEKHMCEFLTQFHTFSHSDLTIETFPVAPHILDQIGRESAAGLALFHPGASSPTKRRPLENFLEMMKEESDVGILLGEVELEQFKPAEIEKLKSMGRMFIDWPLEKVAGLLALSKKFVGNDSGITHLAAAVGADTTVFFVKTDPRNWHPLGPKVTILDRPI
jgi:heptosyltransferase III